MTISSEGNRVIYNGDGATTAFAFPHRFLADSHLTVVLADSTGTETTQIITTQYTVAGAGAEAGGTVTMVTAPASGETLAIFGDPPFTQETDYIDNDDFPAESHETALDKLTNMAKRLLELLTRGIVLKETDPAVVDLSLPLPADRANKYLFFDANGAVSVASGSFVIADTADLILSTKSDVEGATIAAGIDTIFTTGFSTANDGGGAQYKRVGSEPAHDLKIQSADGAWWEIVAADGWVNILQAGADPTGAVDASTAIQSCMDWATYNSSLGGTFRAAGPAIHCPQGIYKISTALEPRSSIHLKGFTTALTSSNFATVFEVDADVTGLFLPDGDTVGDTIESPDDTTTQGAGGSVIEGIWFKSAGGTDATKHGLYVRVMAYLRNVRVSGFPGHGIFMDVTAGSGGGTEGNANVWAFDHCQASDNDLDGFHINGADANAGGTYHCRADDNGRWGLYDSAFLPNWHIGNHVASNGLYDSGANTTNAETSVVSHGGNRYAIVPGQTASGAGTTPGTDATVWYDLGSGGAGASYPDWATFNAIPGTYVEGGGYYADDGAKTFVGCYAEDPSFSAWEGLSQMVGGIQSKFYALGSGGFSGYRQRGAQVESGGLRVEETNPETNTHDQLTVGILRPADPLAFLSFLYNGGPSLGYGFRWDDTKKNIRMLSDGSSASWFAEIPTTDTTDEAGTGAAIGDGNVIFPRGVILGDNTGTTSNARKMFVGTAAPVSGAHAVGEIVWKRNPSAGDPLGYRCVTAGTPGTWEEISGTPEIYGAISVQGGSTGESTVDATPRQIAAFTTNSSASANATPDHTSDDITCDIAADVDVFAQCSFSGSNNSTYRIEIYKNGVATGFSFIRKLGTGGDVGSGSCGGLLTVAATDTIELYQSSTDGGTAMTVVDAQLIVKKA